jgi:DDE domain
VATEASYKGHRYPVEIISHCVWLYYRFALSLRDISEMMLERGVVVSHETVRQSCAKFGQGYANQLRRRRPRPGDKWHVDEVFIRINGKHHYLWLAVDQDGNVLDVLVQSRPKRFGRQEVLPAAPQGTAVCAARARHRHARQLPGRAPRTAVLGRASPVPLSEHSY